MSHTLTLVTSNRAKAEEFRAIFRQHGFKLRVEYGKTIEVQSDDLAEIAYLSCLQAFAKIGRPLFVEDAGLFIDALGGFPGPYSAYVYNTVGTGRITKLLGDGERRAHFKSVISYYHPHHGAKIFTGVCSGMIAAEPKGQGGFGFDPIFIPDGKNKTFAEMRSEEKNSISHRSISSRALLSWLRKHSQNTHSVY